MEKKKKWGYGFYLIFIICSIFWILIIYFNKTNPILGKGYSFIVLSIFFYYAFFYSFFNNEACIYGKITVKKKDNNTLYWIMTLFWGFIATFCIGNAIKLLL